jgi:hypothetical protein
MWALIQTPIAKKARRAIVVSWITIKAAPMIANSIAIEGVFIQYIPIAQPKRSSAEL